MIFEDRQITIGDFVIFTDKAVKNHFIGKIVDDRYSTFVYVDEISQVFGKIKYIDGISSSVTVIKRQILSVSSRIEEIKEIHPEYFV